jgi:hypothetical protein
VHGIVAGSTGEPIQVLPGARVRQNPAMARTRVDAVDGMAAVRSAVAGTAGSAHAPAGGTAAAPVDRATERLAVRYTLQLLTDRAPGHAVEVRIPPHAAVQAIPGPVHRRGTPAAVVEMDARTWLALATGRLTWTEARAADGIRASGERADLGPWLPLLDLG